MLVIVLQQQVSAAQLELGRPRSAAEWRENGVDYAFDKGIDVAGVLLSLVAAWLIIRLVARRIERWGDDGHDGLHTAREQRARTAAKLVRSAGRALLTVVGVLMLLDQLDFKVESIPHLDAVPELVLVPEIWEFPRSKIPPRTFYVEPGVDTRRNDLPFDWAKLDPKKPLIYCAAGGMAPYMHPTLSRRYYDRFHEALKLRPQWQGLLSCGKYIDPASFEPLPNLVVEHAVPQVQVLERAALCMTHGGINTAKEAIYYGVPMVAFPLFYDQFGYAARSVYHGLALGGDMRKVTGAQVAKMMDRVLGEPAFKQRAVAMSKVVRDLQDRSPGADLLERMLAGEDLTRAAVGAVAPTR